jgi:tetratricopeptide (TPR) repeat protein
MITMRAEGGETVEAWREAAELVQRRPRSAEARMALAYSLRYGGALEESARECETAWTLDQHRGLRSCALTFIMLGNYARARDFLNLDAGSAWARMVSGGILLREGKVEQAFPLLPPATAAIIDAARRKADADLDTAIRNRRQTIARREDGEAYYTSAVHIAFSGRNPVVMEMLDEALRLNFCGYPAIDTEPLFAPLRGQPEWAAYRQRAIACHQRFMQARKLGTSR